MSAEDPKDAFLNEIQIQAVKKYGSTPYELRLNDDYFDVVHRLSQVLPVDVMFDWFSSKPEETAGKIQFPYQRVDLNFIVVEARIALMERANEERKRQEHYELATKIAASTLTWIDIGWDGIEKFAMNPEATSLWTSGPGHSANPEQRAQYIITEGKEWLNRVVKRYTTVRDSYVSTYVNTDVFKEYNLEHLLHR